MSCFGLSVATSFQVTKQALSTPSYLLRQYSYHTTYAVISLYVSFLLENVYSLEGEDLVLQFADWLSLLESESFGRLLHGTDHRWWTAKQKLDIVGWLR